MDRPSPLSTEAINLILTFLSNSRRSQDASILIEPTVRLARSIELSRDLPSGHSALSGMKNSIRKSLRWLMLRLDHEFSISESRPLGVLGQRRVFRIRSQYHDRVRFRLRAVMNRLTKLSREIAADDSSLSLDKNIKYTNQLMDLWDTIPVALQFNNTCMRFQSKLAEPLNILAASKYSARVILSLDARLMRRSTLRGHSIFTPPP